MRANEQLTSDFNLLLNNFCGCWETTKKFSIKKINNKAIPNKKFPEHGISLGTLLPNSRDR